jgi:hypothetical protein
MTPINPQRGMKGNYSLRDRLFINLWDETLVAISNDEVIAMAD